MGTTTHKPVLFLILALLSTVHAIDESTGTTKSSDGISAATKKNLEHFCPKLQQAVGTDVLVKQHATPCGLSRVLVFHPMGCSPGTPVCASCTPEFTTAADFVVAKPGAKKKPDAGTADASGGSADAGGDLSARRRRSSPLSLYRDPRSFGDPMSGGAGDGSGDANGKKKKKKDPNAPDPTLLPCYSTTVGTNIDVSRGIKSHVGLCQQLQELFVFYFLFHPRVPISEAVLSKPQYAGHTTVERIKGYFSGYKKNLSQQKQTTWITNVYDALLFAFSFTSSKTWENANGEVKLNANYRNTASFPPPVYTPLSSGKASNGALGTTAALYGGSSGGSAPEQEYLIDSLITSFYMNYVIGGKGRPFTYNQQNTWSGWFNATLQRVQHAVNEDPLTEALFNKNQPLKDPRVSGISVSVCPILSCMLANFMKQLEGQFLFQKAKQDFAEATKRPNNFPKVSYCHLRFRFVKVNKAGEIGAWDQSVTIVIEPYRISWFDGNTAVYVYENDLEMTAIEKLKLSMQQVSGVTTEAFHAENNPLYPYYNPKVYTQIAEWDKASKASFTIDEVYKIAGGKPDQRLFVLPPVDIYNASEAMTTQIAEWQQKFDGSNSVDINSFLRDVVPHLHSEKTDLFKFVFQVTYATRSLYLGPEVFSGKDKKPTATATQSITDTALLNEIYGIAYEKNILGTMVPSDNRTQVAETLKIFRKDLFGIFKKERFGNSSSGLLGTVKSASIFVNSKRKLLLQGV